MKKNQSNKTNPNRLAMIAPVIRGLLAKPTDNEDIPYEPVILKSLTDEEAVSFAASAENAEAQKYPAPLRKTQKRPLFLEAADCNIEVEKLRKQLSKKVSDYSEQHNCKPEIICIRDIGILYLEHKYNNADFALKNKVAVVTGSGGAIGYGICRGLVESGCYLAATDVVSEKVDSLVSDLKQIADDRVMGVVLDVTEKNSVTQGFEKIIQSWGGIDIVVVNAGIAMVSYLKEIDLDAFRRLEKVNVEGALLTLSEAGNHFIRQGTGGDIIVISTKNVPSPGAGFGAYSATKAACHQLGRIGSIELAQYGVRVNMVAPDAVFSEGQFKSGLWEEIGPSRMQARGLDEKELQEYYRSRNLLKARITGRHVSNAVLFFATRQTPTTGATIPVDGGLPDATPR